MKINGQGPVNPFKIYNQQQQFKAKSDKVQVKGDTVELSPEARQVRELARQAAELPDVRAELVQEIKSRLANQVYEVNPHQLAESILRFISVEK